MTDDRLARLALSQLGEPGGPPDGARLVAELGAAAALRRTCSAGRDPRGVRTDVAARLAGHRARARPRAGGPPRHPLDRPRRPGVARVARRPRRGRAAPGAGRRRRSGCGCAGRCGSTRCRLRWRSSAAGPRRPTAPTWRPSSAAGLARAGAHGGLRRGVRDRPGRPPRRPGRRRADRRRARLRRRPGLPERPTSSSSTTSAEHGAIVSEVAPGCAPMRVRFLSRNRRHRRAVARHGRRRGGRPQRRPQHRELGVTAPPAADGGARAGDERTVGGGARS